jgi:GNS1/SUR4 family
LQLSDWSVGIGKVSGHLAKVEKVAQMSAFLTTMTWRPILPDSVDGAPMATTVSDLWYFAYDRLPKSSISAFFLQPQVVLALLMFYLVSKPLFRILRDQLGIDGRSRIFCGAVASHNFGLALFSAVCAWNSWRVVWEHYVSHGWMAVYCDRDGALWRNGLGAWSFIFYISKYYEFFDTWILVLKGKPASLLQVYHHTGIAFIMWCAVSSQSAWLLFVVLLNSVIHTLMYTYFFIKTISPTTEIRAARYLTMAQIGQFLTGIACTFPIFFLGSQCATESSRFALLCLHVYGFGLIALFRMFAKQKYKKS